MDGGQQVWKIITGVLAGILVGAITVGSIYGDLNRRVVVSEKDDEQQWQEINRIKAQDIVSGVMVGEATGQFKMLQDHLDGRLDTLELDLRDHRSRNHSYGPIPKPTPTELRLRGPSP